MICVLLVFFGCGDSESPNEPSHNYDAKEVWPLTVGNYWKFRKINYAWPSPPDTSEINIEKDTILDNEKLFVFNDFSNSIDKEIHSYINREDGFHYLIYNTETNKSEDRFIFKYPCKKGDVFNKLNEEYYTTVANTNIDVIFQSNKHKAILYIRSTIDTVYKENYQFVIDSLTVIPGIGMIHQKSYRGTHKKDSMKLALESELVNYKIN